ncbi:MAG TPA: nicotinate-nucleotide adenylyltransferase [Anaerolineales bacterium]|nr:nicotinate-nucleotide adenylyltransferase [Anaerolineales bacterium]
MNAIRPERLGVFGGTYDPPHIGHLILAEEALYQLQLDRILWMLTPDPPHKIGREITDIGHRIEMLKLALADEPCFELSYMDIHRPAPHYAADTMQLLQLQHPQSQWVYLMGGDSLSDLPTWMRPLEFVRACDEIGVMLRPGHDIDLDVLELALPGLKDKVRFLQAPLLEISSTRLREKMAQGAAYRYYLLPSVYNYIENRQLYHKTLG